MSGNAAISSEDSSHIKAREAFGFASDLCVLWQANGFGPAEQRSSLPGVSEVWPGVGDQNALSGTFPLPNGLQRFPQKAPYGDLLLVGHDAGLQSSRAKLLERIGFRCRAPIGMVEPEDLSASHFVVAVICHTLKAREACQLAEVLHRRSPLTPVLRLARSLQAEEYCFDRVLVKPSPDAFVAEVRRLSVLGIVRRIRRLVEQAANIH